jgi:exonuclease VII small subunit
MSKKNIQSLINSIETQLETLENPSLEIEDAISLYAKTLTSAAELSRSLKKTDQEIVILNEKSKSIIQSLENS